MRHFRCPREKSPKLKGIRQGLYCGHSSALTDPAARSNEDVDTLCEPDEAEGCRFSSARQHHCPQFTAFSQKSGRPRRFRYSFPASRSSMAPPRTRSVRPKAGLHATNVEIADLDVERLAHSRRRSS